MNQKTHDRVWGYKMFIELAPLAAKKALESADLFSNRIGWLKFMDPVKVNHLYHADGRRTDITIQERELAYPK